MRGHSPSNTRPRGRAPPRRWIRPQFDEPALKAPTSARRLRWSRPIPEVRGALLGFPARFRRGRRPGAVLDGRDIGTVIFPDADVKIFLTATAARRGRSAARRRSWSGRAIGVLARPMCWPISVAGTSAIPAGRRPH